MVVVTKSGGNWSSRQLPTTKATPERERENEREKRRARADSRKTMRVKGEMEKGKREREMTDLQETLDIIYHHHPFFLGRGHGGKERVGSVKGCPPPQEQEATWGGHTNDIIPLLP